MADSDFYRQLQKIGLEQYHAALTAEAFDSWSILSRITEQDMTALGIRLGHRRVLQDAIARFANANRLPQPSPQQGSGPPLDVIPQLNIPLPPIHSQDLLSAKPGVRQKRKYVRHPKVDVNAPPRPPTGYVMFSNWVRDSVRDQHYDFPDIAKLVGKRWQAASQTEKDYFLNQAKQRKEQYLQEMARYKRTPRYAEYQRYLLNFRMRTGTVPAPRAHGRRNGDESMDEEAGTPASDEPEIVSNTSDCHRPEQPVRGFRPETFTDSDHSRSPPSVVRSPSTIEPSIGKIAYSISPRPGSTMLSADARSPRDSIADRLPAMSGFQSRQLPPINTLRQ